jgi:hypothetical protein
MQKSVEHQHDTDFKFWNVKRREAIEHDDGLQRLKHRFVQLYVKVAHLNNHLGLTLSTCKLAFKLVFK